MDKDYLNIGIKYCFIKSVFSWLQSINVSKLKFSTKHYNIYKDIISSICEAVTDFGTTEENEEKQFVEDNPLNAPAKDADDITCIKIYDIKEKPISTAKDSIYINLTFLITLIHLNIL